VFTVTHHSTAGASALSIAALTAMWLAMMALMMTPTVWPWVRAFQRFGSRQGGSGSIASTLSFSSGYLAAWLAYSVAAAIAQLLLMLAGELDPLHALTPLAGAGILIAAGVFQLAPLKRVCLAHCRNPISYFLARWRNGTAGSFRLGFGHGIYCVGCCWALMATTLGVGVLHVWWMAALTAAVFVEQVVPRGDRIRMPLGIALILAGLAQAA
jgi:predicted metal-binding membrane protein